MLNRIEILYTLTARISHLHNKCSNILFYGAVFKDDAEDRIDKVELKVRLMQLRKTVDQSLSLLEDIHIIEDETGHE